MLHSVHKLVEVSVEHDAQDASFNDISLIVKIGEYLNDEHPIELWCNNSRSLGNNIQKQPSSDK